MKILYIDDDAGAAGRLKSTLERSGKMDVESHLPTERSQIEDCLENGNVDLVLLDYNLGPLNSGVGLASAIIQPDVGYDGPIVLVTRKNVLDQGDLPFRSVPDLPTGAGFFDLAFFRDDLVSSTQRETVRRKLVSLVSGYAEIEDAITGSNSNAGRCVAELFDIEITWAEKIATELSCPAVSDGRRALAQWIINAVFRFPGPLLPFPRAALLCGIGAADQSASDDRMEAATYDGVFSNGWRRWWTELLPRVDREESALKCSYCRKSHADTFCGVTNKPVHREHSIEYLLPGWPAWAMEFRVGFHVIEAADVELNWDWFPRSAVDLLREKLGG